MRMDRNNWRDLVASGVFGAAVLMPGPALNTLAAAEPKQVSGLVRVIDGQTLVIDGKRLRLDGIDAPQPGQICQNAAGKPYDCGRIATTALMDLTAGATVQCRLLHSDSTDDGRARCTADGYDLSEGMVYTGWAFPDPVSGKRYASQAEMARTKRHGLWRGTFPTPWTANPDTDAPITGN